LRNIGRFRENEGAINQPADPVAEPIRLAASGQDGGPGPDDSGFRATFVIGRRT
jgi:hypothetical protein